jgi:hypothetical protein
MWTKLQNSCEIHVHWGCELLVIPPRRGSSVARSQGYCILGYWFYLFLNFWDSGILLLSHDKQEYEYLMKPFTDLPICDSEYFGNGKVNNCKGVWSWLMECISSWAIHERNIASLLILLLFLKGLIITLICCPVEGGTRAGLSFSSYCARICLRCVFFVLKRFMTQLCTYFWKW